MGFCTEPPQSMVARHPNHSLFSSTLPPLATKGPCPAAAALRQPGQSTERRRVPRPRFKLSNQKPTSTCRSLLADLNAVEDLSEAGGSHCCTDYGFRTSSLIKAHCEPQSQQDLGEWYLHKHNNASLGYQVLHCIVPHKDSTKVHCSPLCRGASLTQSAHNVIISQKSRIVQRWYK